MRKQATPSETVLPSNAVFKVGSKRVMQIKNKTNDSLVKLEAKTILVVCPFLLMRKLKIVKKVA